MNSHLETSSKPASGSNKNTQHASSSARTAWLIYGALLICSLIVSIAVKRSTEQANRNENRVRLELNTAKYLEAFTSRDADYSALAFSLALIDDYNRNNFNKLLRQPLRDIPSLETALWLQPVPYSEAQAWSESVRRERNLPLLRDLRKRVKEFSTSAFVGASWQAFDPALSTDKEPGMFAVYAEPRDIEPNKLGRDFKSHPDFAAAIETALASGSWTRTQLLHSELNSGERGYWFFIPVYSRSYPPSTRADLRQERLASLLGVFTGWVNIERLIADKIKLEEDERMLVGHNTLPPDIEQQMQQEQCNSNDTVSIHRSVFLFDKPVELDFSTCIDHGQFYNLTITAVPFLGLVLSTLVFYILRSNTRFSQILSSKLDSQRRELMRSFGLVDSIFSAAPVGIEFEAKNNQASLANARATITRSGRTASAILLANQEGAIATEPTETVTVKSLEKTKGDILNAEFQITVEYQDNYRQYELIQGQVTDTENNPLGKITVTTDVTERANLTKELQIKLQELGASNAELEHYVFNLSHVLQEPLRRLTFMCSMLKDAKENPEAALDEEEELAVYAAINESAANIRETMAQVVNSNEK